MKIPAYKTRVGFSRTIREPVILRRFDHAQFIPSGMHGYSLPFDHAQFIPSGMHQFHNRAAGYMQVAPAYERELVGLGMHPDRAAAIVRRAVGRAGLNGLGDIVADGTTWITYGNDIVERSKTGNVGSEALKAAQNINTFLGNRYDELQAVSPDTVDALGQMLDVLSKIASGQIKYDSVAGAFLDEVGNAVRGEVIVGGKAVLDAPKKIVKYAVDEVIKPALDVVPWYVWTGGLAVVGTVLWSKFSGR
jgi:hypothetical protein